MIDREKCMRAIKNLRVQGTPSNDGRKALIEEAITLIQKDGKKAMLTQYLGIKNYAAFGDQRTDCEYGMVPTHGSIVFAIRREYRDTPATLGDDEIYYLMCERDFQPFPTRVHRYGNWRELPLNLCECLLEEQSLLSQASALTSAIDAATVEL